MIEISLKMTVNKETLVQWIKNTPNHSRWLNDCVVQMAQHNSRCGLSLGEDDKKILDSLGLDQC